MAEIAATDLKNVSIYKKFHDDWSRLHFQTLYCVVEIFPLYFYITSYFYCRNTSTLAQEIVSVIDLVL